MKPFDEVFTFSDAGQLRAFLNKFEQTDLSTVQFPEPLTLRFRTSQNQERQDGNVTADHSHN